MSFDYEPSELDKLHFKYVELENAAEMLWVCLANVDNGAWSKQSDVWQETVKKWRDNYFKVVGIKP